LPGGGGKRGKAARGKGVKGRKGHIVSPLPVLFSPGGELGAQKEKGTQKKN